MKFLITLLMSVTLSFAFGLEWAHSYNQVMAQSKKENKPVLIFMSQPGCGSCAYMKENVFLDGDVTKYMKEHFVFAELNIYDNDVPDELKVKVTPVFYFLDSEGKQLRKKLIGGKTAPFFIKLLEEANGTYRK